jgi:hypothetical protein
MQFARHLLELVQREYTGVLFIWAEPANSGPSVSFVCGWVHAIQLVLEGADDHLALGKARLRHLLQWAGRHGLLRFDEREEGPLPRRGACAPFHPGACLRAHFDSMPVSIGRIQTKLQSSTLNLRWRPPSQCLHPDEGPTVALLARPIAFRSLLESVPTAPSRTLRLLAFLDEVGLLEYPTRAHDLALLGLDLTATIDDVQKAYHRRAREHHPDLQPGATAEERRQLEQRFADLTAAYRRLQ